MTIEDYEGNLVDVLELWFQDQKVAVHPFPDARKAAIHLADSLILNLTPDAAQTLYSLVWSQERIRKRGLRNIANAIRMRAKRLDKKLAYRVSASKHQKGEPS